MSKVEQLWPSFAQLQFQEICGILGAGYL